MIDYQYIMQLVLVLEVPQKPLIIL